MFNKRLLLVMAALATVQWAVADPMRTVLTKENKMPEWKQVEVGGQFDYKDFTASNRYIGTPYVRYGLMSNLAVFAESPFVLNEPDEGDSEGGLGDVAAGFDFIAWQDVFGFPWIMPHFKISFPTGDEDKDLGTGHTMTTMGLAVGTVVEEVFHFIADGEYTINSGSKYYKENVASIAGAVIWDLSRQFSVMAEIKGSNDDHPDQQPFYYSGGMSYKANDQWVYTLHAGSVKNRDEDVNGVFKISYTF